jgi:glycosyltransferase involved in cell wall biosynthesis
VISCIIPAHNEEELLPRTLLALHESARAVGSPYELIVVNDASTDRTSAVALEHGARVVAVNHRQIAATRNAGARAAVGDLLFFVDADTVVPPRALRAAVRALRRGAVGGGSAVRFDGRLPTYAAVLERLLPPILYAFGLAAGCFLFCTRRAYHAAGGFNERMYWGEEVAFGRRLKRQGRFVILHECVFTSARKLRANTARQFLGVGVRLALSGRRSQRTREGLEYWYGQRRG